MLGTLIKEYMKENGIKQSYVADKMGTSPQILGTILNEKLPFRNCVADE